MRFRRLERVEIVGFEVPVAATVTSRLLGLSLLPREHVGAGLLIPRCRSVHTFGMRFALDLLWLDDRGRVIELRRDVLPRLLVRCPPAVSVLEIPSPRAYEESRIWGGANPWSP